MYLRALRFAPPGRAPIRRGRRPPAATYRQVADLSPPQRTLHIPTLGTYSHRAVPWIFHFTHLLVYEICMYLRKQVNFDGGSQIWSTANRGVGSHTRADSVKRTCTEINKHDYQPAITAATQVRQRYHQVAQSRGRLRGAPILEGHRSRKAPRQLNN